MGSKKGQMKESTKYTELNTIRGFINRIVNGDKDNMYSIRVRGRVNSEMYTDEYGTAVVRGLYDQSVDNLDMAIELWGEDLINDINRFFTDKKIIQR